MSAVRCKLSYQAQLWPGKATKVMLEFNRLKGEKSPYQDTWKEMQERKKNWRKKTKSKQTKPQQNKTNNKTLKALKGIFNLRLLPFSLSPEKLHCRKSKENKAKDKITLCVK